MIKCNEYKILISTAILLGSLSISSAASSQTANAYPSKPVTVIVGFTAGGPTDFVARILAEQLSKKFNQNFIIDNKAGANGGVAAGLVKNSAPDGYTLMFGSSGTLAIAPHLQKNLPYDPVRDFTPIGLVASYPYFLVTPTLSSLVTLDDLINRGSNPSTELSFASAGNGSVNHLAGEWFKYETKIRATHIPYKGDSAAIPDIVSGRVDFSFLAGAAALPQVKAGKLRILASASSVPGRGGENILTLGENRIKGFAAEPWNGLMGPAGLNRETVIKLNTAINEIMNRKEIVDRLAAIEQYPFTGTPEQFTKHINEQTIRWGVVIKNANIK
ncbi:MAG: tripartite tricarboxylate transporter substrate-binding protein [Polaromonas sp.]|nr:tripartite tricarboxylate transporter substrate-binding protein [Polaromonas sp.]